MPAVRDRDSRYLRLCVPAGLRIGEDRDSVFKRLLIVLAAALALAPATAFAKGGNYVFDGGSRAEQAQVVSALDVSSFDFSLVPGPVTIHIAPGVDAHSTPGQIWLDGRLVDAGRLAWGVVQHEYGHQVDFSLLDDADRSALHAALGGAAWCSGAPHALLDCERFADLVSWAYWTSPDNVLKPVGASDEGGQLSAAAFRALLARLLPATAVAPPLRLTAAISPWTRPRKG
jgi:hypothetical protein